MVPDLGASGVKDGRIGRMKPGPPRGRATASNPANRYHDMSTERSPAPDGGIQQPRTEVLLDRSRCAITYNSSPDIPFDRSINPYRGCEHGCIYCYARPTHAWLDLSPGLDFESRLFARPDLPDLLRNELADPGYHAAAIALGSVTDAYQPIERSHRITRRVLEILAESAHPVVVVTKSALVERDIDLLSAMASDGLAEVAVSLTTLSGELARTLEPRAAAPARRLRSIERLSAAGIPVRVMLAPLIPVLTEPEIERLLTSSQSAGARAAEYVMLRLPLEVAPLFREWLDRYHPDSARHVMNHVQDMRGGRDNDSRFGIRMQGQGAYADMIAQRFRLACRRLGLRQSPELRTDLFHPVRPDGQLELF